MGVAKQKLGQYGAKSRLFRSERADGYGELGNLQYLAVQNILRRTQQQNTRLPRPMQMSSRLSSGAIGVDLGRGGTGLARLPKCSKIGQVWPSSFSPQTPLGAEPEPWPVGFHVHGDMLDVHDSEPLEKLLRLL